MNVTSVYLKFAVGTIIIQLALFKNCSSDPNVCRMRALLVAMLILPLSVLGGDKERHFLEPKRDS